MSTQLYNTEIINNYYNACKCRTSYVNRIIQLCSECNFVKQMYVTGGRLCPT